MLLVIFLNEFKLNGVFIECPDKNGIKNKYTEKNLNVTIEKSIEAIEKEHLKIEYSVGYSLGTYPAIKTGIKEEVKKIFLIAPFTTLEEIILEKIKKFFYFERKAVKRVCKKHFNFNNLSSLRYYKNDLYLYHGFNDNIIPFSNSETIKETLKNKGNTRVNLIKQETNHNDILGKKLFEKILKLCNENE
ncbi:hypothetical protein HERIO_762 [Hepatospora eriocheir]|uniref:Alpha/beta hydrolase n=1 Tax=Hepatospora eriocheir TaxID=1081669 RepID=A0A1X0QCG5_9MICR|nr:hypothetical protein HERIO_762 [Hepatospora eriocheir]